MPEGENMISYWCWGIPAVPSGDSCIPKIPSLLQIWMAWNVNGAKER